MTNRIGKEARYWDRALAPVGFLVLLLTLFLAQFPASDGQRTTADLAGAADARGQGGEKSRNGGDAAPSPLSAAGGADGDGLWFPSSGHAERRVAKAKAGLAEGDASGKAVLPGFGPVRYPFEVASSVPSGVTDAAAPRAAGHAAFRSRAPPVSGA